MPREGAPQRSASLDGILLKVAGIDFRRYKSFKNLVQKAKFQIERRLRENAPCTPPVLATWPSMAMRTGLRRTG